MQVNGELQLIERGTVKIYTQEELLKKLSKARQTDKPLNIKLGIDPTMPEIHMGHTVCIRKLATFQKLGHNIILIIGDFTARIGDPSGRDKTRPILDDKTIENNKQLLLESLKTIIDINKIIIRYNSEWLSKINFSDLIKICSNLTVAQMLEREDFKRRYENQVPITLNEFLYPVMQALDSVEIKADIEIGGQDQTYNLLLGRELQQLFGQEPQVCITMPLLIGVDGKKKMSKTYNNTISVKDEPFEMYSKIMSIPDDIIEHYFLLLTEVSVEDVKELCDAKKTHPKIAKERLAREIVKGYYGQEEAEKAAERFTKVFTRKEVPDSIPVFQVNVDRIRLIDILVQAGLCKSNSEAKTLVRQGAVELDGHKIDDITTQLVLNREYILKVGKKNRFLKIIRQ
ncbi:MAG: tyrosine--tRNA ligase [Planctomycetota bacterium]